MWIEQTKDGKYKFVERYKSSLTGRYRRVSVTYGKKIPQVRKEATRVLEKRITDALAKEGHAVKRATVEELVNAFLDQYKQQVRITTWNTADALLRSFVKQAGKDTRINTLTTVWLNRFLADLLYKTNLSNGTVRETRAKLSLLYDFGVSYGYLKENLVKKTTVRWKDERSKRRDEIESKYLTHEEYQAIISDCLNRNLPHYADAFKLQYLTGIRFGELSALQVNDVIHHDTKTYLRIDGTMRLLENPPRHYITSETKTFAGMRKIILSPEAAAIVTQRCVDKDDDALLFAINPLAVHYDDQRPLNVNSANQLLKRIARRQHIDKPVTTHYFRHTHVSVLADMGVPLRVIQKRVGHSKSNLTQQIYLHVTKQTQDDFENRIAAIDNYQ